MKKVLLISALMMFFSSLYAQEDLPQVDTSTETSSPTTQDDDKEALQESMPEQ